MAGWAWMSGRPGNVLPAAVSSMFRSPPRRGSARLERPDPFRQVVVDEHRRNMWPESVEPVVAKHELRVDEVDLAPVRLERHARSLQVLPEATEMRVDRLLLPRLGAHLGEVHEVELHDVRKPVPV